MIHKIDSLNLEEIIHLIGIVALKNQRIPEIMVLNTLTSNYMPSSMKSHFIEDEEGMTFNGLRVYRSEDVKEGYCVLL